MSQVLAFTKAFATAGIGGRFSKFQLERSGEWFSIHSVSTDSDYCFQVKAVFNPKMFEEIPQSVAHDYLAGDMLWYSYFSKAKEVLRLVCKERKAEVANTSQENRYYLDRVRSVMYLANRSNVIAVGPTEQICPLISTTEVMKHLKVAEGLDVKPEDDLKVFTKYGKVVVYLNGIPKYTDHTPKEFIAVYEE